MPYTVEVFDNYDHPNERSCSKVGEYDTAEAAIAAAKTVIDESLQHLLADEQSATQWYQVWASAGDGVYVQGNPASGFNPHEYAKARIEAMTGHRPKEWGER